MKELFSLDMKNYKNSGSYFSRPSVRAVIIKDKKIALIHSMKYDFYKLPGGGINEGESFEEALIRETAEETGLVVKKESIKEFGLITVREKGSQEDLFIQDNYYYLCDVTENMVSLNLDPYEIEEEYLLEFVDFNTAYNVNLKENHKNYHDKTLVLRETKFLKLLKEEGLL